jgi:hypothetical protein
MGKAQRDKGLLGEREVRHAFEDAGFTVRGLEGEGDNLAFRDGLTFHLETKRRERLALPEWIRQAEAEAPSHATPLVVYRRSREPWRVVLPLSEFLQLVGEESPCAEATGSPPP